jgi:glycyl-tRNA synthetase alpha chain
MAEPLLQWFERQGCVRLTPPDAAVSHGVLAPVVFFSLLAGDPWRSVHLQPVRRPSDSRPRLHPHRLAVHHQIYAVLGASPLEPLELILGVLRSLRLDPAGHDLRLLARDTGVALAGVEARGWAVVVDGVDVGRLSWIASLGTRPLDPPVLEVTLGLERLAVVTPEESDGEGLASSRRLRALEEEELATYCLETADPLHLGNRFESLIVEADRLLDAGLVLTAHRSLLEAAQLAEILELRRETFSRHEPWEFRVTAGLTRCALMAAGRGSEPLPGEVG